VHSAISDAKNALVYPAEYASVAMDPFSKAIARVYPGISRGAAQVERCGLRRPAVACPCSSRANPQELDKYRRRFKYILVDEYQDTNRAQYQLVKLLAGGHRNLCVVGDDDQSIYGWRGADIRNILDFKKGLSRRVHRAPRGELSQHTRGARSRERRHQRQHRVEWARRFGPLARVASA
jgi:DNA helicase-2/ATP-dependent DNA helicase PcrA